MGRDHRVGRGQRRHLVEHPRPGPGPGPARAESRQLAAEQHQPLGFRLRPLLELAALLRPIRPLAETVQHRRTGENRLADRQAARQHYVPPGRAVPRVEIGLLRQRLQLRERSVGKLERIDEQEVVDIGQGWPGNQQVA